MGKGKWNYSTALFVFISLLFHLILVLIIAKSKIRTVAPQPKITIIKARLIVARLPKVTQKKPPVIDIDLKPPELKQDTGINSIAVPKTSLLSEDLVENEDSIEPSAKVAIKEPSAKVAIKQPSTPTITAAQIYAASKLILNNQNQQLIEQYTVKESFTIYPSKVSLSEMFSRPVQHQYIAPVMTLEKRRKTMIYCDSTAKKITAMISVLLKGTIECEKLPDLQSFIDNRRLRRAKK